MSVSGEAVPRVHVVMECPHCGASTESDTATIGVPDCAPPCPQSGCQSTADTGSSPATWWTLSDLDALDDA